MHEIFHSLTLYSTRVFKKFWPTLRILLSIGLLSEVIGRNDWSLFLSSDIKIKPLFLLYAFLSMFLAYICGGYRWAKFMEIAEFPKVTLSYIGLYFAGGLINQGLPSTIGGDSYRAISAKHFTKSGKFYRESELESELNTSLVPNKTGSKLRLIIAIVLLDRLMGIAGNNLLGAIGLIMAGSVLTYLALELGYAILFITLILGAIGALGLVWAPSRELLKRLLEKLQLEKFILCLEFIFSYPIIFMQAFIAVGIHFLNVLAFWFCLKSFGGQAPIVSLMIGLPALSLLMILPISISGWGLREATLSSILVLWGANPSLVVAASISYGAISLLTVLPGIYFLLKHHCRSVG